ncbi:MAG TPA: hypothetical protein VHY91_21020 [Pirellulales bacterium]|nr:hypothetical protein [Pirellulales bacterium]
MFVESALVVGMAGFVLAVAYLLDSYQAKLFRQPKPSPVERHPK